MKIRKYNPDYHSLVVRNLRDGYKKRFNSELTLADALVWDTYEEWGLVQDEDHLMDADLHNIRDFKHVAKSK